MKQQFSSQRFIRRFLRWMGIGLSLAIAIWLTHTLLVLKVAAAAPTDAVLVLGGSIQREIYAAQLRQGETTQPILISTGSSPPCVWTIFDREGAAKDRVWLEDCADSTFSNFVFSAPILKQWNVRKVKLITSSTHLPRALWLGRVMLGARGIWVEPDIITEKGVPGNRESWWKTGLDLTRGFAWAIAGYAIPHKCPRLMELSSVDMKVWEQREFRCEHQGEGGVGVGLAEKVMRYRN